MEGKKPRRSKYEEAYQYWLFNPSESILSIAKRFNVDDSGLNRYVKKNKESEQSGLGIQTAIVDVSKGLDTLQSFMESESERDRELASKAIATLEQLHPQMKNTFANIANRVLNAFDKKTQAMEATGELHDLTELHKTTIIMKELNNSMQFIPRTPLVAVQNNINNQNANVSTGGSEVIKPKEKIEFSISFVDTKKEDDVVDGEIVEN